MEDKPLENNRNFNAGQRPDEIRDETPIEATRTGGWRAIFKESLLHAQRNQKPTTGRRELGKDRSKSLFVLAAAAVVLLLLIMGMFSSPKKAVRPIGGDTAGEPNLGRRQTPGESNEKAKSVIPLLSADLKSTDPSERDEITPEEVERRSNDPGSAKATAAILHPPTQAEHATPYALRTIEVTPAMLPPVAEATHLAEATHPAEDLRKPSLVFVRSNETARPSSNSLVPAESENREDEQLAPGTRVIARLQSPASTAVHAPVVAAIEYDYLRDGQIIIPAGTKIFGKLDSASSSGYVGIRFDSMEMHNGSTRKIAASAEGLDFKPLKGQVTGKNTAKKFIVGSLTGLGEAAAYAVGPNSGGSFSGSISESELLRERFANNVGIAGDQQLSNLAFNQNIVVTIPGNTRFYLIFDKGSEVPLQTRASVPGNASATQSPNSHLPSAEELRQLLQLRDELHTLYEQGSQGTSTSSSLQ